MLSPLISDPSDSIKTIGLHESCLRECLTGFVIFLWQPTFGEQFVKACLQELLFRCRNLLPCQSNPNHLLAAPQRRLRLSGCEDDCFAKT